MAAAHLLNDAAIGQAKQRLRRELRLAVEPAAALGLGALLCGAVQWQRH